METGNAAKRFITKQSNEDSSIGMATVYRMMTTLEEIGVIERRCVFRVKDEVELLKIKSIIKN